MAWKKGPVPENTTGYGFVVLIGGHIDESGDDTDIKYAAFRNNKIIIEVDDEDYTIVPPYDKHMVITKVVDAKDVAYYDNSLDIKIPKELRE